MAENKWTSSPPKGYTPAPSKPLFNEHDGNMLACVVLAFVLALWLALAVATVAAH